MEKQTFKYEKGKVYSLDAIQHIMNMVTPCFRKPEDEEEAIRLGLHKSDFGYSADHEICERTVTVTVTIN